MRQVLDKRTFYSQPEVSDAYDQQRFGGASGARVNRRELDLVLRLLPPTGRILDLACGTGRLSRALQAAGRDVVGLDYSPPMAAKTAALGVPTVVGDAFTTPFRPASFDAAVALRFAFHWENLEAILAEMRRLVRPGGAVVLDTYSWSPRSALALGRQQWGDRVFTHSPGLVRRLAFGQGLVTERMEPCFLVSPYVYRLAPLRVELVLEALEARVPPSWLCRVFWAFRVR